MLKLHSNWPLFALKPFPLGGKPRRALWDTIFISDRSAVVSFRCTLLLVRTRLWGGGIVSFGRHSYTHMQRIRVVGRGLT